jgi:limonene-1,2-epoxide hydrolase
MKRTEASSDPRWRFAGTLVLACTALLLSAPPAPAQENAAEESESPALDGAGVKIVEEFVAAFKAQDLEAIMSFFTEDAIYHNMPGEPATGIVAVRALIESYVPGAAAIDWEILAIAETGSTVLTERVDRFVFGETPVAVPVMGAFEIRDGKISAWRDYFDLASMTRQLAN